VTTDQAPTDLALLDVDRGVATITFNRPESNNGWTGGLEQAYYNRLEQCQADPDVKVIVVTGAGRSFCPGADMNMLSGAASGGAPIGGSGAGEQPVGRTTQPLNFPATVTKPVIGAINGACAGVGLVQALMFDLRFAAEGAKFTVAFARRGLIAEYGSAWLLPRLVGQSNALDLLLSSRVVLADEAQRMGLVNRVIAKDDLLGASQAYARDLAQNCSPTSMAVMKQQVTRAWEMDLPEAMTEAYRLMNETLRRPDFVEGVSSFVQKRTPTFGEIQVDLLSS
jgi:enoyl-CoA hydratase/carnithine racemase